jgi:hypothetical protein
MSIVDDTLKVLDRIPIWKRLGTIPAEVDGLTRRVAELEAKLGGKWPADVCKHCGERALRLTHSAPSDPKSGKVRQNWFCNQCNKTEVRID